MGRGSPIVAMGDRLFTPIKPADGGGVNSDAQMAILGMIQKNKQQHQHQGQQGKPQAGEPPNPPPGITQPRPQSNEDENYRKNVVRQKCESLDVIFCFNELLMKL